MKKLLLLLILIPNLVMADSFSFNCKFSDGIATNFDTGSPESQDGGNFTDIIYDQISPKEGTGRIIGNAGAEDVMVHQGYQSVNIIEITPVGNMTLTTIFNGLPNKDGLFPVVHSRHPNMMGAFVSQFVGLCSSL
jgi:hypothetical protein